MSSNSSNSSKSVLGNTKTKTQDSPSKRWVFTLNNYVEDDISSFKLFCSSNSSKFSVGREIGDSGTPHLQGYIELAVKKRFSFLKDVLPKAHIEKAKGNRDSNIVYTQKEGNFFQNFKEEVYFEKPSKELLPVMEWIKEYTFPKGDRKINVVVDRKGGIGKTEFCRYVVMTHEDAIITGGKSADMKNQIVDFFNKNGRYPKYILIDVPRKNIDFLSYQGIEEVKNMLFYSGKYEGGMICGNKPFLCLFMNDDPDYSAMSEDRWRVLDIKQDNEIY